MGFYTNHYEILKIERSATKREVKSAFKRLAKIYHPDVYSDDGEMFKKINLAYTVLSDEERRKTYDLIMFGTDLKTSIECMICNDQKIIETPCFKCNQEGSYIKKVKYGKYDVDSKIICTLCLGSGRIKNVCKTCKT